MRRIQGFFVALAAVAATLGLGCTDSTGAGTARVTVLLTDAPSVAIKSAVVEIGAIDIIKMDEDGTCEADGSCEHVRLTDDGGSFDLLDLQNGTTATLASLVVEPGRYRQIRFVVESATITLDGDTFTDGSDTKALKIPSGAQTGIKVNLGWGDDGDGAAGIEVVPGETVIVIDFDVMQNFRIQGNPNTPAGIKGVLFTPMLRAVVRDVAGSIAGTVSESGTGTPMNEATVMAVLTEPATIEALQTDTASALTGETGEYTLRFLPPGKYKVWVVDFSADTASVTVGESENVTGINFVGTF